MSDEHNYKSCQTTQNLTDFKNNIDLSMLKVNNSLEKISENMEATNSALLKLNERQEEFIEHKHEVKNLELRILSHEETLKIKITHNENEVKKINESMNYVRKIFFGTLLVMGIKSVYDVKSSSDVEASLLKKIESIRPMENK